jgi:hypothetical protein
MAKEIVVATYQKSETEQVRVFISEFKNNKYTHIRSFWKDDNHDEWQFGKGLTIPFDAIEAYDALIEGLQKIKASLETGELLPGEEE